MPKFEVTFSNFGVAVIDAPTLEDANKEAATYKKEDISWSDCHEVTDVQEMDE